MIWGLIPEDASTKLFRTCNTDAEQNVPSQAPGLSVEGIKKPIISDRFKLNIRNTKNT
jgi:hypothetical protein